MAYPRANLEEIMGFPRGFNTQIRQWDDWACEAAVVAQIAWMSGKLSFPFSTTALDRALQRPPGKFIPGQYGMQYLLRHVPRLKITAITSKPVSLSADPNYMRRYFQSQGILADAIDEYLKGDDFRAMQGRVRQFEALRASNPARLQVLVAPDVVPPTLQFLNSGSLAVYSQPNASGLSSHTVAVMRHGQVADSVHMYDPDQGLFSPVRLSRDDHDNMRDEGVTVYTHR